MAEPLDQGRRRALCERILEGDRNALVELASLYHDAGYHRMAEVILAGTFSGAQNHARAFLGVTAYE